MKITSPIQYFLFVLSLVFLSCSHSQNSNDKDPGFYHDSLPVTTLSDSTNTIDPAIALKNSEIVNTFFKDVMTDTLFVYSTYEYDDKLYRFHGQEMNVRYKSFFPYHFRYSFDPGEFYGCMKFPIGEKLIGLICRTPGEYSPTALKLMIYDKLKDSITSYIHVSDVFGDAGEIFHYNSCILRNNNYVTILTYGHSSVDHSVDEDSKNKAEEHWNHYCKLTFNSGKFDTVSKDSATITNQHREIIKKMMGE